MSSGSARRSPEFAFSATVWLWNGDSPWHFISLPKGIADDIAALTAGLRRGFGSVRVEVESKGTTWRTSIFPDRKSGTFILPLKKEIRVQLGCEEGSKVRVLVRPLLDGST